MPESYPANTRIEQHTIYPIPADERHGRAADLFTLWFGSNIMILTIVTGALATTLFKLSLMGAILSILIGNLVGGVFMALHAAQGPQLGVPQMVQSRGQFGSFGAIYVVALVVVMYVGFVASNLVLGGQSLHSIAAGISDQSGIVMIAIVAVAAAIYGYDLIHAYGRWMSWLCGLALLACFVWIIAVNGLPADIWRRGHFSAAGFMGTISVGALWQIAYAPYVSDYSRYMPADSGVRPTFWASYWGCVLGSALPMLLGALLGLTVADGNVVAGLAGATRPISVLIVVAFSIGIGSTSAMNIYCGVLSSITVGQTFLPNWNAGSAARIVLSTIFILVALAMALWGAKNFLVNYENFLALLLCVMAPWTAINLVDFYLVQHGHYDVPSFFRADGGIYGRYNWTALFCYVLGIAVQVPFLATDLYTGPIATALGGADISWLVALAVVSPLYYTLAHRAGRTRMAENAS
ncbi:MAG: cytosine permease [Steroidobacteraceae bacterium]|jgi:NCS1 family nucleobase:cation symporter-1